MRAGVESVQESCIVSTGGWVEESLLLGMLAGLMFRMGRGVTSSRHACWVDVSGAL